MPDQSPMAILADNLARLVALWSREQKKARDSIRGFAVARGIQRETDLKALRRAMRAENIELGSLAMIASHLDMEAWKLLHPQLDVTQPFTPGVMSPSAVRLATAFDALPMTQEKMTAFAVILEVCERTARGEPVGLLAHAAPAVSPETAAPPAPFPASPAPRKRPFPAR